MTDDLEPAQDQNIVVGGCSSRASSSRTRGSSTAARVRDYEAGGAAARAAAVQGERQ